jgi:hypothetical protein
MKNIKSKLSPVAVSCALGLASLMAGCSGGGGGSPANLDPLALQGIWTGASSDGTVAVSAVVLSSGDAWVVTKEVDRSLVLSKATLLGSSTDFKGAGKQYITSSKAMDDVTVTAAVPQASTVTVSVAPKTGIARSFTLGYQSVYDTAAILSDIGTTGGYAWAYEEFDSATPPVRKYLIELSVDGVTGALTGKNTDGCSYAGTVAVHSVPKEVGVFDLNNMVVTCPSGTKNFSGIVTLNPTVSSKARFLLANGTEGTVWYVDNRVKQLP